MLAVRTTYSVPANGTYRVFQSLRRDACRSDLSALSSQPSRSRCSNPSDGMLAVRTARAARREYMRDGEPVCEHLTARACFTWLSSLLSPVHAATNVPQMSCGRTLPCRTA